MLFNNPEFVSDSEDEAWLADGPRSIIGPRLVALPSQRLESLLSAPLRSYISGADAGKARQKLRPHNARAPTRQRSTDLGQQRFSKLCWTDRQGLSPRGSMHAEPVPQKARPASSKLPLVKTQPSGAVMAWQGLEAPLSKSVGAPQFGARATSLHKKARAAEDEAIEWLERAQAYQVKDAHNRVSHSQAGTTKRAKLLQQSFVEDAMKASERASAAEAQHAEQQRAAAAQARSAEESMKAVEWDAVQRIQLMIAEASQWTRKAEERAQAAEDRAREQEQAGAAERKCSNEWLRALEASSARAAEQLQQLAAVQARQAEDRAEAGGASAWEKEVAEQLREVLATLDKAGGRVGEIEVLADEMQRAMGQASESQGVLEERVLALERQSTEASGKGQQLQVQLAKTVESVGAAEARVGAVQRAMGQASRSQGVLEKRVDALERQSTEASGKGQQQLQIQLAKMGERAEAAEAGANRMQGSIDQARRSQAVLEERLLALERQSSEEFGSARHAQQQQAELAMTGDGAAGAQMEGLQEECKQLDERCVMLEQRCDMLEAQCKILEKGAQKEGTAPAEATEQDAEQEKGQKRAAGELGTEPLGSKVPQQEMSVTEQDAGSSSGHRNSQPEAQDEEKEEDVGLLVDDQALPSVPQVASKESNKPTKSKENNPLNKEEENGRLDEEEEEAAADIIQDDMMPKLLARFRVNTNDTLAVFKAISKEDFQDVLNRNKDLNETLQRVVNKEMTMNEAVGPAVGCLMATFGTDLISLCIFDFDDPEELRYYDVEERIELWGLQIPHTGVRPPLEAIAEDEACKGNKECTVNVTPWTSIDRLNMSIGLLYAMCTHALDNGIKCGFCVPRPQLLKRWLQAGVCLRQITSELRLIYPESAHDYEYYRAATVAYFMVDEVRDGLEKKLALVP